MKKVQLVWSAEALIDLEIIYDFIAGKSPESAQRITENILTRIKQIETFPESGARQETLEITQREYRYLVEGNYKIIYSHREDITVVYVETIYDTRYDPEKMRV